MFWPVAAFKSNQWFLAPTNYDKFRFLLNEPRPFIDNKCCARRSTCVKKSIDRPLKQILGQRRIF
jgi:hypothetical protein